MIAATTLCIVLAHTAASDCVIRHRPLWERAADRVVYVVPNDAPLPWYEPNEIRIGWNSKYGAENNIRVCEALRFAAEQDVSHVILTEYDAVIWGPIPTSAIPPAGGLSAARFTEPKTWAGINFVGDQYFHFPIIFDRAALRPLVAQMDALPIDAEAGYADRYIGLAAQLARIPHKDLFTERLAFTRDTIDGRKIELCRAAVQGGVRFSHGIKSAEAFYRIVEVAPWR